MARRRPPYAARHDTPHDGSCGHGPAGYNIGP